MIITLCGSTKFKKQFEEVNRKLTLMGHIVLSCGVFPHSDSMPLSEETKESLDKLHFAKIDMSEAIYVINVDGYIGHSTSREIMHAHRACKDIYYLEGVE